MVAYSDSIPFVVVCRFRAPLLDEIVNKEATEEQSYFGQFQTKAIEGSAVVKGSNFTTPTISIETVKDTSSEQREPTIVTQTTIKRRRNI
jgi:hypothetical protein